MIDIIPVLSSVASGSVAAATLAQSATKAIVVSTEWKGRGIVAIYGHLRNNAAAGGAARKIATLTASVELEPGGGYTDLVSGTPAKGLSFDASGVNNVNIDSWGRFSIMPDVDNSGVFSEIPMLDISSLKLTLAKAASPTETCYLDCVLYVQYLDGMTRYANLLTASFA